MPESLGVFSALLLFVGFNLTFFPQFIPGYWGTPRRTASYVDGFQVLNVMSTAARELRTHSQRNRSAARL